MSQSSQNPIDNASAKLPIPYYQDEHSTIYHGDCRDILPLLDPVDLVLTDPPYGIGFREYESHDDDPSKYNDLINNTIFVAEKLVENGWVCVFQAAKKCREWHVLFPREWRLLCFPKTFVQIFKVKGPQWATDYALLWHKGEVNQKGKLRDWKVTDTANMSHDRGHPCARPLKQIQHCVEMLSEEGNLILDPFMGSGTTLVAAKNLGRKAIGIELEEKYCEIAVKRLRQGVLAL